MDLSVDGTVCTNDKRLELDQRARRCLAGGVSSEFRKYGYPDPMFYSRAEGSRIYDVDGNAYLDFSLSQGPLILGHSRSEILDAVTEASRQGQLYAGQFLEEIELAETIQELVPCAEMVRFGLDGSTTVQTALRLARAVTGRPKYLRFEGHYHGWLDNVAMGISAPSVDALGIREAPTPLPWTQGLPQSVLDEVVVVPWNDLDLVERVLAHHSDEIAAIITEPIMCNSGCIMPEPGFLQGLRSLADRYGVVLIFDEVITGFRIDLGGAQKYFGVTPDLAIFAKAVASGYPLSILAGKADLMGWIADGRVIHAGTLNASVPSVAAARATLAIMSEENIHQHLFDKGNHLMQGLRETASELALPLHVQGPGPMFHTGFTKRTIVSEYRHVFEYESELGTSFVQGMHRRGVRILTRGLWYISAAHTDQDIAFALNVATDTLTEIAAARVS